MVERRANPLTRYTDDIRSGPPPDTIINDVINLIPEKSENMITIERGQVFTNEITRHDTGLFRDGLATLALAF